jgi:hypothetical protein
LDEDDVAFLFEDLHRGRSVIPPHNVPSRPVLIRWDVNNPLTLENCVVMEAKEADLHSKDGKDRWGKETETLVERRREEVRQWRRWLQQ